jgi:glycogen(starch) synthase
LLQWSTQGCTTSRPGAGRNIREWWFDCPETAAAAQKSYWKKQSDGFEMHIVIANQWYPPESGWGGVGMHNYTLAHAFRALGHDVTVIASRLSQEIPAEHETDGIRVRRILVRDLYRWRHLPVVGCYVRPAQQLGYARRVNEVLHLVHKQRPIDVVEFAEINAEGFFYAREPFAPFVVRCHTPTFVLRNYYQPAERPYDTRIISWCERRLIQRAHALTAPSHDMARVIARETPVSSDRITAIPNALALPEFSDNGTAITLPGQVTILHVGRLERAKGVVTLARAIPFVLRRVPNARFVFVGGDRLLPNGKSQRGELERILVAEGTLSGAEFPGEVDQPTLRSWYHRADVCVVPSMLYESFSYTCAQAMGAGKPIVASRIGGIPETVDDGKTGLIVEPGDVKHLAEAIVRLARSRTLREQMGQAGREKVRRTFDPLKVAGQSLEVYAQAQRAFETQTS